MRCRVIALLVVASLCHTSGTSATFTAAIAETTVAEGRSPQDSPALEARALAEARRASTRRLDPSLPARRFDDWFRTVLGPDAAATWVVTDCGEATGSDVDGARDLPLCVEAAGTRLNGLQVAVNLLVGTSKTGVGVSPRVYLAYVKGPTGITVVKRLADLPGALAAR